MKVNNDESPTAPVISGIPQGSVLGPLLFVIYINDLPDTVNSPHVYLFADDTKLMREVTSSDDAKALQRDLNELEAWSNDKQNESKSQKVTKTSVGSSIVVCHLPQWQTETSESLALCHVRFVLHP